MARLCTGKSGAKGHFPKMSKPVLVHTHLPVQLVWRAVSLGVGWSGHEGNHSPPFSAQVKFECLLHVFVAFIGTTLPLPSIFWNSFCGPKYVI